MQPRAPENNNRKLQIISKSFRRENAYEWNQLLSKFRLQLHFTLFSCAHISPEASASTVRAHEQEHVSNAYKKASQGGGKVISANVSLKRAICPECGRSYVSGGTTSTKISYPNEQTNPYAKNKKSADASVLIGSNIDLAV